MKRPRHSIFRSSSIETEATWVCRASTGGVWLSLAVCSALLGVACEDGAPRDLGSSSAPITLDGPFNADVDDFTGRWSGAAADVLNLNGDGPAYHFPSGSTQIELEVMPSEDLDGRGPLQGVIRFGTGAPLPPPTDPDSGYPVGVSYDLLLAYDDAGAAFVGDRALPPFEGVDYSVGTTGQITELEDGSTVAADGVINFAFNGNEPLDAWCRLQTPHPYAGSPSGFSCLPDTGGGFEVSSPGTDAMCELSGPPDTSACTDPFDIECIEFGTAVASVNCDKVFLCGVSDYCACSADGCSATDTSSRLTVRRLGDELVGIFQNMVFVNERNLRVPLGEVRLQRVD